MAKFSGVGLLFFLLGGIYACTTTVEAPVAVRHGKEPTEATVSSGSTKYNRKQKSHIVNKGDTLYSIAWRYGHDYKTLASWNLIRPPFIIYPGQVIHFKPGKRRALQPPPVIDKQTGRGKKTAAKPSVRNTQKSGSTNKIGRKPSGKAASVRWRWPTRGKLLKSVSPTAQKGISISGKTGQRVVAAATGEVVYSGSGLRGYGKLIIIKHNDTYLSAYAYNQELIVAEGERVKAGQQISTMGLDSKGTPVLHFEIRKNGKPVNPLQQLPRS